MPAVAGGVPKMPEVAGGDPPQGAGMPAAPQPPTPLLDNLAEAQRGVAAAKDNLAEAKAALTFHRAKKPPKAPPLTSTGEQGEGQGPPVGPTGQPPLLGPETATGAGQVRNLAFFMSMRHFEGDFRQHSAALKYFRQKCEAERNYEGLPLSAAHTAAVAAIVHPLGVKYWFV